jgi:Fe-S cluster assembly ATP-binding protein
MPLLEVDNIVYGTGPDGKTPILAGLSLNIEPSEVHALLGTNGTGKSTLAYLVMGCEGYHPSAGDIRFDGKVINSLAIHERARLGIAMAWQEPVRFEGITVRDYLCIRGNDVDPAQSLDMVGLAPTLYLARMVDKSLSGGERKRIELASILTLKPRLAILDPGRHQRDQCFQKTRDSTAAHHAPGGDLRDRRSSLANMLRQDHLLRQS